jgi:hypothetical protein
LVSPGPFGLSVPRDRNRKAYWNHGDDSILRCDRLGTMVPLRFRSPGYGRRIAHFRTAWAWGPSCASPWRCSIRFSRW